MKNPFYILVLILLVLNWAGKPLPEKKGTIIIEIEGSRNEKGYLLVSLFKEAHGFPSDGKKAFRKTRVIITKGITLVEWKDMPEGAYAAALLHDENDDQKMNFNLIGLPKEGYAFSNNVMGLAGPPSFHKASFLHQSERTVHRIKLRY